eukprot:scaffold37188_cov29-Attheya_sp.AAC.6
MTATDQDTMWIFYFLYALRAIGGPEPPPPRTVYLAIIDPKDPSGNIYTNLCGRFPILSTQGNQYIFILYDYDSNAILSRAMKNRSDKEMTRVFSELADTLKDRGFKPQYHVLDNECSAALKSEIQKRSITYQL